jgi:hypothetical protein
MCSDGRYRCSATAGSDASFAECQGPGTCGSDTHASCVDCQAGALCNGLLNPGGDNNVDFTQVTITCQ